MNFESAQRRKGRFLLRIEDIDATRCRPEFETAIYQDLAWLGVSWEIPVRRQSEHLADYRAALDRLAALGVLYPSFESSAEIAALVKAREVDGAWPRDPDGVPLYPGTAKSLAATEWVHNASEITPRGIVYRTVDRALIRWTSGYFGVAEVQRRFMVHERGYPDDKIRIIHNGVDAALFDVTPAATSSPNSGSPKATPWWAPSLRSARRRTTNVSAGGPHCARRDAPSEVPRYR